MTPPITMGPNGVNCGENREDRPWLNVVFRVSYDASTTYRQMTSMVTAGLLQQSGTKEEAWARGRRDPGFTQQQGLRVHHALRVMDPAGEVLILGIENVDVNRRIGEPTAVAARVLKHTNGTWRVASPDEGEPWLTRFPVTDGAKMSAIVRAVTDGITQSGRLVPTGGGER
jgi:hypothetical protein